MLPSPPSPWGPGILLVLAVSIWWLHWWSNAQKDLCLIISNNMSCVNPSLACFYCGPDPSPASGKKDCFPSQLQAERLHPILPNTTFFLVSTGFILWYPFVSECKQGPGWINSLGLSFASLATISEAESWPSAKPSPALSFFLPCWTPKLFSLCCLKSCISSIPESLFFLWNISVNNLLVENKCDQHRGRRPDLWPPSTPRGKLHAVLLLYKVFYNLFSFVAQMS